MRLDKYLKVSRLIKRRTVANEVADAGRILINRDIHGARTALETRHELIERDTVHIGAGGRSLGHIEALALTGASPLQLVEHAIDRHDDELARRARLRKADDIGGEPMNSASARIASVHSGCASVSASGCADLSSRSSAREIASGRGQHPSFRITCFSGTCCATWRPRFRSGMNRMWCCGSSRTILTALDEVTQTSLQLLISMVELT